MAAFAIGQYQLQGNKASKQLEDMFLIVMLMALLVRQKMVKLFFSDEYSGRYQWISFTAERELGEHCGTGLSDIDAMAEICIGGLVLGVVGEDSCIGKSCDIHVDCVFF